LSDQSASDKSASHKSASDKSASSAKLEKQDLLDHAKLVKDFQKWHPTGLNSTTRKDLRGFDMHEALRPLTDFTRTLLVVVPCTTHRHSVAYSSRSGWRAGLKTFVASNGSQLEAVRRHGLESNGDQRLIERIVQVAKAPRAKNGYKKFGNGEMRLIQEVLEKETPPTEQWGVFPDEVPNRGQTPGDWRMLAAVRLANESFARDPDWQWMVYGDDDTVFLLPNLHEVLRNLDPEVPYYISDDIAGCCHGTRKRCNGQVLDVP
jgi:hypothetical protein